MRLAGYAAAAAGAALVAAAYVGFAIYDHLVHADPDAELRRFLDAHPGVDWYWTDGTRGEL